MKLYIHIFRLVIGLKKPAEEEEAGAQESEVGKNGKLGA